MLRVLDHLGQLRADQIRPGSPRLPVAGDVAITRPLRICFRHLRELWPRAASSRPAEDRPARRAWLRAATSACPADAASLAIAWSIWYSWRPQHARRAGRSSARARACRPRPEVPEMSEQIRAASDQQHLPALAARRSGRSGSARTCPGGRVRAAWPHRRARWLSGAWVVIMFRSSRFFFLRGRRADRGGGDRHDHRARWTARAAERIAQDLTRCSASTSRARAALRRDVRRVDHPVSHCRVPYALVLAAIGGALEFLRWSARSPPVSPWSRSPCFSDSDTRGCLRSRPDLAARAGHVSSPLIMGRGVELHPGS